MIHPDQGRCVWLRRKGFESLSDTELQLEPSIRGRRKYGPVLIDPRLGKAMEAALPQPLEAKTHDSPKQHPRMRKLDGS